MTQGTVQDVGSLIDKLAAKLSVPAAHLWDVLTRQARVEAWSDIGVALLWVGVAIAVVVGSNVFLAFLADVEAEYLVKVAAVKELAGKAYGTVPSDPEMAGLAAGIKIVRFIVVALCLVAAANYGIVAAMRFMNPEYFAVREILSVFGK